MASVEQRLRKILSDNFELDGKPVGEFLGLDNRLVEAGLSSADAVALVKKIEQEFGVKISPEDGPKISTLGKLIGFVETNASS